MFQLKTKKVMRMVLRMMLVKVIVMFQSKTKKVMRMVLRMMLVKVIVMFQSKTKKVMRMVLRMMLVKVIVMFQSKTKKVMRMVLRMMLVKVIVIMVHLIMTTKKVLVIQQDTLHVKRNVTVNDDNNSYHNCLQCYLKSKFCCIVIYA